MNSLRDLTSACPIRLGLYPNSAAILWIFAATSGFTRPRLCSARSTVPRDTPASSAICCAVTAMFFPPYSMIESTVAFIVRCFLTTFFFLYLQYSTMHASCNYFLRVSLFKFTRFRFCTAYLQTNRLFFVQFHQHNAHLCTHTHENKCLFAQKTIRVFVAFTESFRISFLRLETRRIS